MKNQKPYYIIETAFHHEGDLDFLTNLISSYSEIEADAVKFHLLFDVEDYMVREHPAIEVLKSISIPAKGWPGVFDLVKDSGKDIVLLCNDLESLRFVNSIQDDYPIVGLEIHSTGLNDVFLLDEALNFKKTVILGVGGSSFDELQFAVNHLTMHGKSDILLIHGFQNYPTNYADINLNRMKFLKDAFDLPVGYADHTDPQDPNDTLITVLPLVLGFNIIEKHVTNVFGEKRIDHQAAVSVQKMKEIISVGNEVWKTRGQGAYELSDAEKNYGNTGPMKKALVARNNIVEGEEITLKNIAFKRTESSSPLLQKDIEKILGCKASKEIAKDQILTFDNVRYEFKIDNFKQFFVSENQ